MMLIDTKKRSEETEIMDDFTLAGPTLRASLDQLATINKWLGGNAVTLSGLREMLADVPRTTSVRILDLGCGNGDLLRLVADWGRRAGRRLELVGIDGNADTVAYARELSLKYPEIAYRREMIPSPTLRETDYDLVLCTLFLHHFSTEAMTELLAAVCKRARIGVIVNDLQRSKTAYSLFNALTFFIRNRMIREDGLTSILRGFQRRELQAVAEQLPAYRARVRWRWAFRYQWLLWTGPPVSKEER